MRFALYHYNIGRCFRNKVSEDSETSVDLE
jgi:hypothetical protein